MANQVTVSNDHSINVTIEPPANVQVEISRAVIGTVANVASANFANFAGTAFNVSASNITGVVNLANFATTANNVAGANVSGAVANATYANTSGSANTAGTVTTNAQPNITSVGTLTGLTSNGNIIAPFFIGNVVGNISGNFTVPGNNTAVLFNQTGNAGASDALTFNYVSNVLTANGNIVANYFIGNGSQLTDVNAVTSNIANTANSVAVANVVGIGNIAVLNIDGNLSNILYGNGIFAAVPNVSNVANANYANFAGTVITNAQPNITSVGTLTGLSIAGNIIPTSNITYDLGNNTNRFNDLYLAGNTIYIGAQEISANASGITVSGNLSGDASGLSNIAGANVTGQVGNALIAGTVYTNAQPNITSVGNLTSVTVSGDALVAGNLTVGGNISYVNVNNLVVQDPVIELGGGPNGAPLTTNDGKDRGTLLHYYTTAPIDAFMGWDNGNGEFAFGSNVTNNLDVMTFNTLGNVRAQTFIGNLTGLASSATVANSANAVAGANVSGQVGNALIAGTVYTNAQPNITSVGTLTSLSVTGNITSFANIAGDYFLGNGALLTGVGNFSAALGYHGSFFSNVTQTAASTTTAYPVTLNNTSAGTYGVSVASNSRVTFTYAGTYNIQYSFQFTNPTSSIVNVNVWLRKNGTDVPDSNSQYAVLAKHGSIDGQLIAAINYIEDINANDYYELIWQTENTSVFIEYIAPGTTPTSPATPSAIVTAMQVTNVQAATLSGNLTGDLIGNTFGLTGTSFVNIIGNISGNVFTGNGSGLTQLTGANVTGAVSFATTANSVALANVSGAGNIASINLDGNVSNLLTGSGTFVAIPTVSANANYANFAGQVVDNTQSNITAVGNLSYLQISNSANSDGVITRFDSNAFTVVSNFSNLATYQLTTQYHPNNSTGYAADRTIRSRGNATTPTTAVANDRIYNKSALVYNGSTNVLAVSDVFTATGTVNANTTAQWTGGQWNLTTGNPAGDTANQANSSWQNQLIFTNSGSLQITPGTPANTSLGQATSSLLITNYGSSTANLVQVGGLNMLRARGNRDSQTNVLAGDQVGRSVFIAYSNGAFQSSNSAQYRVNVDSTYVDNDVIVPMSHNFVSVGNVGGVATFPITTFYGNGSALFPGNIASNGTANLGALNITGVTNLGNVGNVKITGGTANYVLKTDGTGNLDWVAQSGGGGTPGGSNTELQFNNNGTFGGISTVTWNGSNISLGAVGNVKVTGGVNNEVMRTDGTGNLSFSSIAQNLLVGTRAGPYTVPITNYTFQVTTRTSGNVTVYVN